ncbi:autophagy- protein 2 [Rhizopus stolonifer]|uniref:Autophagy-related protein 2 n=1 Tax=Rhizopus stolonifer TaxID=4846 RepID=A0A367KSV1_RHIST|nr:autophagy- protein 2 [Rhizopus stolonifer]
MKAWNYLSGWTNFSIPSNIQKRLYKFILKKAIGPFLQDDLDLENFDIELVNGSVELRDLKLNLDKLNELLQDTPFMVEKGQVSCIHASLPWANHWSGVSIDIQGLEINLVPVKQKKRKEQEKKMEESIMSSSLHFADDFIKSEIEEDEQTEETLQRADGIYVLTRTIDKLFAQLKVSVTDTVIHITHTSAVSLSDDDDDDDEERQYSIDICLPGISYFDETPEFNKDIDQQKHIDESSLLTPQVPNETIKIITLEPPSIWLRSVKDLGERFYEAESSPMSDSIFVKRPYEALLFTALDKNNWIRIKTIPLDENAFHVKQVDFLLTHLRFVLSPEQAAFFLDLLDYIQDSPAQKASNTDILEDLDVRNQQKDTYYRDNAPEQKVKIKISKIEFFLLSRSCQTVLDSEVSLQQTHIRFVMDQFNIRMQQLANHGHCINILFSSLQLDEWIQSPINPSGKRRIQYNSYQPILQFDNSIVHNYSDQDVFPSFCDVKEREQNTIEAIRIKLDKKGSFVNGNASLYEDVHVDIQPFKLFLDPRIIDRFDSYICVLLNRKTPAYTTTPKRYTSSDTSPNRKVQVKCSFIRLVLFSPDMSQAKSRYEFNDKNHESQLSVDVKKATASWSTSPTTEATKDIDEKESNNTNYNTRINIELNYVNVFIKEDTIAQCWFTAKTIQDKRMFSEAILSPSIEITIKDPQSIHFTDAEADMPHNLFDELKQDTSFIENQSDSALIFKQRTIETSQFVINCHLPSTQMNLTKSCWDKVQIIQNDLILWQPGFLLNMKPSPEISDWNSSLFSIVAVLSQGHWCLYTSPTDLFTLQFSEFKYFACMKHMGRNENITTLDIEDLLLYDNNTDRELLFRTIPKTMNTSRNRPMVSIFSRLSLFPDINEIIKESSIVASSLCWKATTDIGFMEQLVQFQQAPDNMVFIDPPKQHIKIYAHVIDTSIDYDPKDHPSRCVILLDGIQVVTDILNGQPMLEIKVCVGDIQLLLLDKSQHLLNESNSVSSRRYWLSMGLVPLISLQNIELITKLKLLDHLPVPKAEIDLMKTDIYLDTSPDSFQTLVNLITHLSLQQGTTKESVSKKKPLAVMRTMNEQDVLASLDENAFRTTERKMSPPTLIEVPEMDDYDEEFYGPSSSVTPPMKPKRHMKRTDDIVRLLVADELEVVDDFYGSAIKTPANQKTSSVDLVRALFSLRVSHVNLVWRLYDGYDWDYVRAEMAARKHDRKAAFTDQGGFDGRQRLRQDVQIEFQLTDISVSFDLMPSQEASDIYFELNIYDISVIDNIKTSAWKKMLGYMKSASVCRENDEGMVHVELTSVRPIPDQQELRLKVKLLPIRLFVDQDALNFLVEFFTFDKMILKSTQLIDTPKKSERDDIFFQYVSIHPMTIKIDYKPKYLNYTNLKEGQLAELINLFSLDGAEMSLCAIKLSGITGIDPLLDKLAQAWLPHIKQTQVPHMVSGVAPIRSLTNLGTGVADLVLLPVQQYRKDGRIIRGLQKGTLSFARATAIEAIKLSSRIASGTQVILEHADEFFALPPQETPEVIDQNFVYTDEDMAQTILAVPTEEEESNQNVIRAVPVAVIRPMIGLTGAFQSIFNGLRNSIDPVRRLQSEDKYKNM